MARPSPSPDDGSRALFDLLARIDELESLREQLDELGISTVAELEERIAKLEVEAAAMEEGR